MQREHVQVVAGLLDLAGDGSDEEAWARRYQEHLSQAMRTHGEHLRGTGHGGVALQGVDREAEVLRARLHLHEVVAERLEARAETLDAGLAAAMAALRRANAPVVREALSMAAAPAVATVATAAPAREAHELRLSCQQLLRLIEDVYASKAAAEAGEPCNGSGWGRPGSLEWHLYACLERSCSGAGSSDNCGGEEVVHERAMAVFAAVQAFAMQRCEVEAFGKMLQNRLPESFAATIEEQKLSLRRLLHNYLDESYQHRPHREREAMWRVWVRSGVPLGECERSVGHLYRAPESTILLQRLRALAGKCEEVALRAFEQLVLRFHMQLTEAFLEDLVAVFDEVDPDGSGAVDAVGLERLARALGIEAAEGDEDDFYKTSAFVGMGHGEIGPDCGAALRRRLADGTPTSFSECVGLFGTVLARHWEERDQG